jgi:hypothetical protein
VTVLIMTLWFWRDRRKRQRAMSVVEETRLIHDPGPVTPEPPDTTPPP